MAYFDHAASTPLSAGALRILSEASAKAFANPAASHKLGKDLSHRLEQCRGLILQTLNADPEIYRLVFTSSATEANNMVIQTFTKKGLVVKAARGDHPSVLKPVGASDKSVFYNNCQDLKSQNNGIEKSIDLLVLTHVNSQSGLLFSISENMGFASSDAKAIHIDCAQSFCKLPIDLSEKVSQNKIDSVAISAHKMGGPKGISALVHRKDFAIDPLMLGGDHEYGLRPSTVALPLVLAWAASVQERASQLPEQLAKTNSLAQTLAKELNKDSENFLFPFAASQCSPYINCIIARDVPSDMIVRHLQEKDIILSSSTACSSKSGGSSEVFEALGIKKEFHKSVLRISFGAETTEVDVLRLAQTLRETYNELKKWTQ